MYKSFPLVLSDHSVPYLSEPKHYLVPLAGPVLRVGQSTIPIAQ